MAIYTMGICILIYGLDLLKPMKSQQDFFYGVTYYINA